jgi:pimeloyl-ACP methyl ester carboxylesterase
MQRRGYEQQQGMPEAIEAADPVEQDPTLLSTLRMPALIAAGEFDLPDFQAGAEELARLLPGARAVEIPGAGHLAPLETPEAFRKLVVDFLG